MLSRFIAVLICALLVVPASADQRRRTRGGLVPSALGCTPSLASGNHPRVLLNECTDDDFVSKISVGGSYHALMQNLLDEINTNWATIASSSCDSTGTCGYMAEALGVFYRYHTEIDVTAALDVHSRSQADVLAKGIALMDYATGTAYTSGSPNYNGSRFASAVDLLWPGLSSMQKTTYGNWLADIEIQNPNQCDYPLEAELSNSQQTACWSSKITSAIVLLNEGIEDVWASTAYGLYDEVFRAADGITTWENLYAGTYGGDPSEGVGYGMGYTVEALFFAEEAWRTAHGTTRTAHYTGQSFFKGIPDLYLSDWIPWGEGGGTARNILGLFRIKPRYTMTDSVMLLANHWVQNAYDGVDADVVARSRWVEENLTGGPATSGAGALRYLMVYILMGPQTTPTAVSPTTQSHPTAYRAGTTRWVFTEDWTSGDAGKVWIDSQKWQHGDTIRPRTAGSIVLARNGWLNGPGGSNSNSPSTDYWAGASSGMCFPDRSTANLTSNSDGNSDTQGCVRRTVSTPGGADDLTTNSTYDLIATVRESFAAGADTLSAVWADYTRSYDSDTTPDPGGDTFNRTRISSYTASHGVTVQSDRVVVVYHGRTVTKATDFVQTFIVQSPVDFSVTASSTTANTPVRNPSVCTNAAVTLQCAGTGLGHTSYTGITWPITASQTNNSADGKLWISCLKPATCNAVKVGGDDGSGNFHDVTGTYSMECADLYGRRWPCSSWDGSAIQENYMSRYRIELTNGTAATTDTFIVVEEVTASAGSQSTTTLYANGAGGNDFDCVRIGTKGFCFGEDGETKTSGDAIFSESVSNTEWKWCGLNPSVQRTFTPGSDVNLGSGLGVAVNKTPDAGTCVSFADIDTSGAGSGANNTVTVS